MSDKDILPKDTNRQMGRSAQRNNILAGKLVAETVRTTLGPKGMDKMLVNQLGDVVVTNDGVTILEEIAVEHPAAKMIVEIAKTQEDEVGDGTTTAVIIAGELLGNAEKLLDKNIHPTVITKGYRLAAAKAKQVLRSIAQKTDKSDRQTLIRIAQTAMTGKGAELAKESLAILAVDAITSVTDTNPDNIRLETRPGKDIDDSHIIQGLVVDKPRVHSGMPKQIKDAKILLLNTAIEIKDTEIDARITISDPNQMDAFLQKEEHMLRSLVDKIIKTGATTVFCQKGVDDLAQHYLAKAGIYVARRVKKSDMDALSIATGARTVTNLDDVTSVDLGACGMLEETKVAREQMTLVTECRHKDIITVILHAGTEHIVDEVKRAMEDALGDLAAALKDGAVVGGAGAPEMEVARELRTYAESLSGREQLAVMAFADAVEAIPVTLAENAGLDPIDIITALKAAHDNKQTWAGVDIFSGKVIDAWKEGIIEPLKIKIQAIQSASEVATMILRIDDVIAAGIHEEDQGPPQLQ